MKNIPIIIVALVVLCFSWSCRNGSEEAISLLRNDGFPTLSSKNVALRLSYDVEMVNRSTFDEEVALNMNYVGLEAPVIDHKSLYYEIYEDNTMAYAIKIFEPLKADDWSETKMIRLIKVMDGMMTVFDEKGVEIFSEPRKSYHIDPLEVEAAGMTYTEFVKAKLYKPSQVFDVAQELLSKESILNERSNGTITFRIPEKRSGQTASTRTTSNDYDVVYREVTYNEDMGIPLYELAYNATGKVIEELTYYYKTENSGERVLSIERFARLIYSEADQIEYTSIAEYFYSNLEVSNP